MAEVLFILTTIFVAYVVFVVVECEKRKKEGVKQAAKPEVVKPVTTAKAEPVTKVQVPAAKKPAAAAPAAKPAKVTAPLSDSVKNPKTGEVSKIPNNYRFAKRWIKEALVSEGLLDRIYKNNEIDDAATAKIEAAIDQLRAMAKYQ